MSSSVRTGLVTCVTRATSFREEWCVNQRAPKFSDGPTVSNLLDNIMQPSGTKPWRVARRKEIADNKSRTSYRRIFALHVNVHCLLPAADEWSDDVKSRYRTASLSCCAPYDGCYPCGATIFT